MATKKQILRFNLVMGVLFLISLIYILLLVWGKQVWNFLFFIRYDYFGFSGEGPLVMNYPLFILIADLLGNLYLWSRLPSANKGLPEDDLRF